MGVSLCVLLKIIKIFNFKQEVTIKATNFEENVTVFKKI
jgi:hypothetical protein